MMSFTKKTSLLLLLTMFVVANVFAQSEKATEKTTEKEVVIEEEVTQLPDLALRNLSKKKVNVADYGKNEKITVFAFWATWCAPCKKELSNIAELYEDWQEEYDVEVVAVSIDDAKTSSRVKAYIDTQGWDYDVLLDVNEDLKRSLNFQSVPYTVVVDHEGDIVYEHQGYVAGDEHELEEILKEIRSEE